ncbi:MAG TPA: hypothetical protein VEU30_15475, partial [Thermoanaerobaculia bacterium]|nr:hypothetical protein [Thermoanaerobaculia bacterium]
GFPTRSHDTAGRYTSYTYDTMGRPKTMTPPSDATTSFSYATAWWDGSQFHPSTVSATTGSIQSQEQYDGLDRLWRSKRLMPDGTWSVKQSRRDLMNRVLAESEFETLSYDPSSQTEYDFAPSIETTYANFDAFGRPTLITTADGKTISLTYAGVRETSRTYKVATSTTAETSTKTVEEFDAYGRLWRIRENATSTTGYVETTYTYDAADRLRTVTTKNYAGETQTRTFTYDGRGFLTGEYHPESGTKTYQYDAGGHMFKRVTPTVTLWFDYDKAERPRRTLQDGLDWLTENFYDRPNSSTPNGTDYSNGKLDFAIRHNYQPLLGGDIAVKETYRYTGRGGRISAKETEVIGNSTFAGQSFTESYAYDTLGALTTVTYPSCSTCPTAAKPARTVSNGYTTGYLTSVGALGAPGKYASAFTYHPNSLLATIQHTNANGTPGPLYAQNLHPTTPMARPSKFEVTNFCTGLTVTDPLPQWQSTSSGGAATLSASASSGASITWYDGAGNAAGTGTQITVYPTVTTTYYARAASGGCTVDSGMAIVEVAACPSPNTTITAASSITASSTGTASVPSGAASYSWSITNGTIIGSATGNSITYRAHCSGSVTLNVSATASCGTAGSNSRNVSITRNTVHVTGSQTIDQGQTATITATLTGVAPFTVVWSDGVTQSGINTTSVTRGVSPAVTTTYTATATDFNNCPAVSTGSAVITVNPCSSPSATISAASSITASANGTASVAAGAGSYAWSINNGTIIGSASGNAITYRAGCSGLVTLSVTVTASCGEGNSSSRNVSITRNTVNVTGSQTIAQGGTTPITATLTGTAPFTVVWSDGVTQSGINTTSVSRNVTLNTTTTYTATATDAYGCAAVSSGSATITVIPPAPGLVAAYATGTDRVFMNWTYSGLADSFE